ncbi:MAG: hypothetical protein J5755_01955, partial [Clostridia bacterium]|nr:hypothetical protein [Clostridia bacterium]
VEHEMLLDEGAEKVQYKVTDIEIGEGDLAVVKVDGEIVPFAQGHEPDGEGIYDFYYVPADGLVYITKHEQEASPAILTINGEEHEMALDESAPVLQYKLEDVEFFGGYSQTIIATYDGQQAEWGEGQAYNGDGTYDFYLNCVEMKLYVVKHPVEMTPVFVFNYQGWEQVIVSSSYYVDDVEHILGEYALTPVEGHGAWLGGEIPAATTEVFIYDGGYGSFGFEPFEAGKPYYFYRSWMAELFDEVLLIYGEAKVDMALDEEQTYLQYKLEDVVIPAGVEVKVTYDLLEVPFAQGQEPDGEGTYDFYLNVGESIVYVVKHEQAADPAILTINGEEHEMALDESVQSYLQYKLEGFELTNGYNPTISAFYDGEEAEWGEGQGLNGEGTYDFYLNCAEMKLYVVKHDVRMISVYFFNKDGWESVEVYTYFFNEGEANDHYLGRFEMQPLEGHGAWMSGEIPLASNEVKFNSPDDTTGFLRFNPALPYDFNGIWYADLHDEVLLIYGETKVDMALDEEQTYLQYKLEGVAIPADVEAKVTYDLLEVPFAQGQEPDGEGTYNFYFNVGEFLVYTTKQGGGEQPHDPEEHIYLVLVGED